MNYLSDINVLEFFQSGFIPNMVQSPSPTIITAIGGLAKLFISTISAFLRHYMPSLA